MQYGEIMILEAQDITSFRRKVTAATKKGYDPLGDMHVAYDASGQPTYFHLLMGRKEIPVKASKEKNVEPVVSRAYYVKDVPEA